MPEIVEGDDDGMPDLADISDDEDNNAEANAPSAGAEARPISEAEKPPAGARAPPVGTDARRLGLETFDGKGATGAARARKHIPTSIHLT